MLKVVNIVKKGQERKKKANTFSEFMEKISQPMDEKIIKVFKTVRVNDLLEDAVNQLVALGHGTEFANGITLKDNFPDEYELLVNICNKLGIKIPYAIVNSENYMNAFTCGSDSDPYLVLTNMLFAYLTKEQLTFVIAHECGHIAMNHMIYHTAATNLNKLGSLFCNIIPILGPAIANALSLGLIHWERCSEITADRVGLVCCKNLKTAQMALLRLISGFKDIEDIDIENYINQAKSTMNKLSLGKFNQYMDNHPMIYKRLEALELFSKSYPYYEAIGEAAPIDIKLLTKEELNKKTDQLMKIL